MKRRTLVKAILAGLITSPLVVKPSFIIDPYRFGGGVDMLTDLTEVWEFDESSFDNAIGQITGATGLIWTPYNTVGDVAGLLNSGGNLGALDGSSSSTAYRIECTGGGDVAYNSNEKRMALFGLQAAPRSFSRLQWFKVTTNPAVDGALMYVGSQSWSNDKQGYLVRLLTGSNQIIVDWFHSNIASDYISLSNAWTLNTWQCMCLTYDHTIDEVRIMAGGVAPKIQITSGPMRFDETTDQTNPTMLVRGTNPNQDSFDLKLRAHIDQGALWTDRVIDQNVFDAIYNSGAGLLYSAWT